MLRRNVLIFHSGALGDFVLSWPLALALGRLHPQSRIIYVTAASKGKLAERALRIESADIEAGWRHLYADAKGLPEICRKMLGGAHSIYAFVGGAEVMANGPTTAIGAAENGASVPSTSPAPYPSTPSPSRSAVATQPSDSAASAAIPNADTWTQNIAALAPEAKLALLPAKPPVHYRGHATEFLLETLAPAPAVRTAVVQILSSIADAGLRINRAVGQSSTSGNGGETTATPAARKCVVIHPGSGGREKCWPAELFLKLIDRLAAAGHSARVAIGEVEIERWPAATLRRFAGAATVVRPSSHVDLLAELSSAHAFVGNDSGPSHLAGIIGVPSVVLFGPTDPTIWRPLGPNVRVIRAGSLEAIGVDEVVDGVERLI
jgi:ADP-heptose:LPS heptosyltransferase